MPRENPCKDYTYARALIPGQAISNRKDGSIIVRRSEDYIVFSKQAHGTGWITYDIDSWVAHECGRRMSNGIPLHGRA